MESYREAPLSIDVVASRHSVRLLWSGQATARQPTRFLLPFLFDVANEATALGVREVEVDLRRLEYCNSECLGGLVAAVAYLVERDLCATIVYDASSRWQARTCAALAILEIQSGGRVTLRPGA